jgi:hypothetical protein
MAAGGGREAGSGKREEGRGKREEGRGKREEGTSALYKKDADSTGRRLFMSFTLCSRFPLPSSRFPL